MAARVTQAEKELMWKFYQKLGTFKAVADRMRRSPDTVSRHVREYEASVRTATVLMHAKEAVQL